MAKLLGGRVAKLLGGWVTKMVRELVDKKVGRWVAKMVAHLLAKAAFCVQIKTPLKNRKRVTEAKEWPTYSSPPKNITNINK